MKQSFLYHTYQTIARRFGICLLFLVLSFGIIITISSQLYIDQFKATANTYYAENFTALNQSFNSNANRFLSDSTASTLYESESYDALNAYFENELNPYDAIDYHLLIKKNNFASYSYQEKIIPAAVLQAIQQPSETRSQAKYQWVKNKLWLTHTSNEKNRSMILATPISGSTLDFITNWAQGEFIQSTEVTNQDYHKSRNFLDWSGLIMSYPIDEKTHSYLTVTYKIDPLFDFFYTGYAVALLASLLGFVFSFLTFFKTAFQPAIDEIKVLETQVTRMASGDYSQRIKNSEFTEFLQLEDGINQLSTAVEFRNKKLKKDVKELHDILIEVLEQKDPYTRGHSERVANYSCLIGKNLGIQNLDSLYSSALLHDIGKISISDDILRKSGKLTESEYAAVQAHPLKGFQLLLKSSQFEPISEGVLYHHERIDGSGYPCGLTGEKIPLFARIIAVADVYDAITSDRSYRKAMSIQQAVAIIREGQGTLFDYDVVESLFLCMECIS